jgi:hypothetical protein
VGSVLPRAAGSPVVGHLTRLGVGVHVEHGSGRPRADQPSQPAERYRPWSVTETRRAQHRARVHRIGAHEAARQALVPSAAAVCSRRVWLVEPNPADRRLEPRHSSTPATEMVIPPRLHLARPMQSGGWHPRPGIAGAAGSAIAPLVNGNDRGAMRCTDRLLTKGLFRAFVVQPCRSGPRLRIGSASRP